MAVLPGAKALSVNCLQARAAAHRPASAIDERQINKYTVHDLGARRQGKAQALQRTNVSSTLVSADKQDKQGQTRTNRTNKDIADNGNNTAMNQHGLV